MSRARSAAVAATVSLSMAITPLMVPPAAVADEFAMRSTGSIGSIAGGGGANTLVGPDTANTWTVTGADAGTLGTTSFTGIGLSLIHI